jgi:hypothetical protein
MNMKKTPDWDHDIGFINELTEIENKFNIQVWKPLSEDISIYLSKKLDDSPTVVSRDPRWLQVNTKDSASISIFDEDKIIWFILMDIYPDDYLWKNIHERVSLWVDKPYRWMKIWKYLMMKITKQFTWEAIASYTPNEKVWHVSTTYLWFEEVLQKNISPEVIRILEWWWPLDWEWYKFFFNQELLKLMSLDVDEM